MNNISASVNTLKVNPDDIMSSSNERKLLLPKEEFDPNLATNFTTKGKILTLKEKKELKRIQEEKRQDESIIKSLINSSNGKI